MDSRLSPRSLLSLIVIAYLAMGTLYAVLTPLWQVPDEPAHYNYIRALARGDLPVLKFGDYDQDLLSRLTAQDFPPDLSIAAIEYEDHQPPLYYLLATPIFLLFNGAVLPLRLLSVLLGAGLLVVAFGTVRALTSQRPRLALMTAAFIAFIPQHVAMTAGVNNDTLAELFMGATLWALVAYVDRDVERGGGDGGGSSPWPIGLLLAGALLTKTTAYVAVIVAGGAILLRGRRERRTWRWALGQLAWMFTPALLLSAPWFVRNALTYGWGDPLGLARHNAVVAGQPRSYEWLAEYGWGGLLRRMARTTFHSFWGQLGWMEVVLPSRIYQALFLFSLLLAVGFIIGLIRGFFLSFSFSPLLSPSILLPLSALLTFLSYLWYNLTFVQHQGRYLFPALIPIGTAAALGLDTLTGYLPQRMQQWGAIVPFAGMAALDVYCLFKSIPFLTS